MKRIAAAVAALALAGLAGCGSSSSTDAAQDRNLADCVTMTLGEVTMTADAYKRIVDGEWAELVKTSSKDGKAGGYANVEEYLAAKYPNASTEFAAPAWCAEVSK